MQLKIFTFLLLNFLLSTAATFAQGIGSWQTYLPYHLARSVALAGDEVFVGTQLSLFSLNAADGSMRTYSRTDGMADINITALAYSAAHQTLIIGYENGNLDFYINGQFINVPDIKQSAIIGEKRINEMVVVDDKTYLACSFGVVVLDIPRREVSDTYYIGEEGPVEV